MNHVLIIDSDLSICEEIKSNLQNEFINIYYTQFIDDAMEEMKKKFYTLIILNSCLSKEEIVIIEQIRKKYSMPILVLSETTRTADKVAVLKSGADDFLNKPYDLDECLARARALMRRYTQLNDIFTQGYALLLAMEIYFLILHGDRFQLVIKKFHSQGRNMIFFFIL